MTIENKRKKGVIYAKEISQSCTEIINSISNVFKREHSQKIESIGHLCNHLFFVRKRLIKFGDIVQTPSGKVRITLHPYLKCINMNVVTFCMIYLW